MTTSVIILSFHPTIQLCTVLLLLYVLLLGMKRFAKLHLGWRTFFNWKRHVYLGSLAMIMLLGGAIGGMTMVYMTWEGFFITGTHAKIARAIVPLIFFGFGSGLYIHKRKRQRIILPLLHGLCNTVLVGLCLYQVYTGVMIYRMFVLGIY